MILLTYCILAQILVQKKYVKKTSNFCCTFARELRADNISMADEQWSWHAHHS